MPQSQECPGCSEPFELPSGAPRRLILRGKSGYLIVVPPETPIHRCASLTTDDERMLLEDAAWTYREGAPESGNDDGSTP